MQTRHRSPASPGAFEVVVPASTTNLGPGFDILGLALGLYNRFECRWSVTGEDCVTASGEGGAEMTPGSDNLIIRAARRVMDAAGAAPRPLEVYVHLEIPVSRGLGSSSTAIVAGMLGVNALLEEPLTRDAIWRLAVELEGHPDNVTAALFGGMQLVMAGPDELLRYPLPPPEPVEIVVCIPCQRMDTNEARRVLPREYPREDAIFNAFGCALFVAALMERRPDRLRVAMRDRIHQPYRTPLLPGLDEAMQAALAANAFGASLSGSGSTILAFAPPGTGAEVGAAMAEAVKGGAQSRVLPVDTGGAQVRPLVVDQAG